ncbi:Protein-ADP-ribose hydrolase [Sporomusa silvacetica DSM 10669]|uniref:Protein-ADP-ribose hydrolase n=1 Tax=Sporomusa silvacetica DSM 10669 TaxID=1123289 RepID=A0ABZ3IFW4_9FIRM|nr:protein-ADP-ribose hydrolase [Sporomusa silvacetica]OZC16433.1 O-acetyl-ADP-ribose deacetylase [Sporomusa silvacetica DSM 10669]
MQRSEMIGRLNEMLLKELPQYNEQAKAFMGDIDSERRLLRSLMNVRPPMTVSEEFLMLQDALLLQEREERGVVDVGALPTTANPRIVLWQGDITRLKAEAIVNAANSAMLGCFVPCHRCIDNAIHSSAGVQLRQECHELMKSQGVEETTGCAKITAGYNLPAKYVLHTVGPIINGNLTQQSCDELANCYRACLSLAAEHDLASIAFCCISTGEYHFPQQRAAEIAVQTVNDFLCTDEKIQKVVFNVFTQEDWVFYKNLLL